jgi:hypothetical protein
VQKNIKIPFEIKSTIEGLAQYDQTTKIISFQNNSNISLTNLIEELFHAVQDVGFYGNTMTSTIRNYEFEAKVFRDLAENFHMEDCPGGCSSGFSWVGTVDQSNNFRLQYESFINSVVQNRVFSISDVNTYMDLCNQWIYRDYNNNIVPYSSSITPQVLRSFFGKLRPPKP